MRSIPSASGRVLDQGPRCSELLRSLDHRQQDPHVVALGSDAGWRAAGWRTRRGGRAAARARAAERRRRNGGDLSAPKSSTRTTTGRLPEPGEDRRQQPGVLLLGRPVAGVQERQLGAQQPDALGAGAQTDGQLVGAGHVGQHGDPRAVSGDGRLVAHQMRPLRSASRRALHVAAPPASARSARRRDDQRAARAVEHHRQLRPRSPTAGSSRPVTIGMPERARDDRRVRGRAAADSAIPASTGASSATSAGPRSSGDQDHVAARGTARRLRRGQPRRSAAEAAHVVGARGEHLVADRRDGVGVLAGGGRIASAAGHSAGSAIASSTARMSAGSWAISAPASTISASSRRQTAEASA